MDITEELRRYKELMPVWRDYMNADFDELISSKNVDDYPKPGDPRLREYLTIEKKLREIALDSDSVVINDPTLHRIFHGIRKDVLEDTIGENGDIEDGFFWHLADKYHPNGIAQRLSITRPLVTLNEVPAEIEALITETREAFCLDLPTACISLCRSVVERAIVDIAVRCGRINDEDRLNSMGMCDRISLLLDRSVSKTSPLRKEINAFMAATSDVIHSKAAADTASALKLFEKARELIQQLYGYYKNQLKK